MTDTRQRLLHAACRIFAEKGYRKTTIPAICAAAEANVASVNYHFQSKENLYLEAWQHALALSLERHPIEDAADPDRPPEERLRIFITGFLDRVFAADEAAWFPRMEILELVNPTDMLESIFDRAILPQAAVLRSIIHDLTGGALPLPEVRACAMSVVGQCMFYALNREARQHLTKKKKYTLLDVERLADHVTRFSLAGIQAVTEHPTGGRA